MGVKKELYNVELYATFSIYVPVDIIMKAPNEDDIDTQLRKKLSNKKVQEKLVDMLKKQCEANRENFYETFIKGQIQEDLTIDNVKFDANDACVVDIVEKSKVDI